MLCNRTKKHLTDGVEDALQKWGASNLGSWEAVRRQGGREGEPGPESGSGRLSSLAEGPGLFLPVFMVGKAVPGEL